MKVNGSLLKKTKGIKNDLIRDLRFTIWFAMPRLTSIKFPIKLGYYNTKKKRKNFNNRKISPVFRIKWIACAHGIKNHLHVLGNFNARTYPPTWISRPEWKEIKSYPSSRQLPFLLYQLLCFLALFHHLNNPFPLLLPPLPLSLPHHLFTSFLRQLPSLLLLLNHV